MLEGGDARTRDLTLDLSHLGCDQDHGQLRVPLPPPEGGAHTVEAAGRPARGG